jgi:glycosidase
MQILNQRTLLLCSVFLLCAPPTIPVAAQTLARPGWAGSGLTQETWWQNAVFYRVQPKNFQDSDGDGTGDLRGIAQRLDYLQSLGVDAIVLESPFDDAGFDDLLSEATSRHVRIIVELAPHHEGGAQQALAEARSWLTRGAAGLYAKSSLFAGPAGTADPLQPLRQLVNSFPGDRILLTDNDPAAATARRGQRGASHELVDFNLGKGAATLENYRGELAAVQSLPDMPLVLQLDGQTPPEASLAKIAATMLLASHGPVSLRYGQEIGIESATASSPTMQWTPGNITLPKPTEPVAETPKPTPPPQREDVYTAFVPYVPPPTKPKPRPIDPRTGEPSADPNSLMGFTSGKLSAEASVPGHESLNVAVEDLNPDSLLNFYRRLSQLHHGSPALQTGSLSVLDHNADNALVWVRQAPGVRETGTVIIACNLSAKTTTLSLQNDIERLHLRPGGLRMLLVSDKANMRFQTTQQLTLAPWSVFIGELHSY